MKGYTRDPKGIKGGKYGPNDQDEEDFEQEKLIQQWLKQGPACEFDFQHINRKGNARNTLIKASVRLDRKIGEDSAGTFADIIVGDDGRDLYCGGEPDDPERSAREKISWYLSALGFNQGEYECLEKMLKLSILENKSLFEKLVSDSEW